MNHLKMKIRILRIVALYILVTGCDSRKTKIGEEAVAYDTICNDGKIESVLQESQRVKNGWSYYFYPDGRLERKLEFKNGLQFGLDSSFYPNGEVKKVGRWVDDEPFGDFIRYFDNGNIEKYSYYDFDGHCRYIEKYSKNGEISSREGVIVGQVWSETDFDSIYANNTVRVHITTANPPNSKTELLLMLFDSGSQLIEKRELVPISNMVSLQRLFAHDGLYTQMAIGRLYDLNHDLLLSDTLITEFNVKMAH